MAVFRQYRILILFQFAFFTGCFTHLSAQKACTLSVRFVDTVTQASLQSLSLVPLFPSKENCLIYIQQLPDALQRKGYLSASIDSVKKDSNIVTILLFLGKRYTWNRLSLDSNTSAILTSLHYHLPALNAEPFTQEKVDAIYNKVLDFCQNNGYPFAKIKLDNIVLDDSSVSATLSLDKSFPYYIDSIRILGKTKLSQDFIHRYLNMAPHELYNAGKLNTIDARLAELSYLKQSQPWSVAMLSDKAILNLYLAPKQSNQIDVIAGFLPANQQVGGKLLVTGQATINLKNAFAAGETFGVDWQQLQAKSPRLNLLFQRPYLFHSPLGFDFNFGLYKRDSFFVNINAYFGVRYNFTARQTGTLFLQTASSRLLSVDTNTVILTKTLPSESDLSSVSLGVDYRFSNTDYSLNPRRGNEVFFTLSAGSKTVQKNTTITGIKDTSFNWANLYDTVQLKSYRLKAVIGGAHYIVIGRQATLKAALNAGLLQSPAYYVNEMFQIGGFKLLRGFDEESIYANRYAVATLEYRYLLAQNSYFYVFTDDGYAHYQSTVAAFSHTYIGAGFGLAFEAKSGIFNISYAVGKRNDATLNFGQSKIHLGFVTVF
ncbi:MAG: hypothetical protein M3R72_08360 [Bacteroidota bacterium]|nr:hypothetical protein [Bacteroidota bacterium]